MTLAGWFTTAGFSRPPYAQLQVSWASGSRSALVLGCCGLAGIAVGLGVRRLASGFTLWIVDASDRDMLIEAQAQAEAWMESADPNGWTVPLPGDEQPTPTAAPEPAKALAPTDAATRPAATVPADAAPPAEAAVPTAASAAPVQAAALADELPVPAQSAGPATATPWRRRLGASMLGGSSGIDRRRQVAGVLLVLLLPLVTAALLPGYRAHSLSLSDDLLIFLVCVVGVAVVGGFWPAVLAAVTASLLLNWFFTPPVHTFTIADPQNMLALLLFVTVAVSVSSVVHLAARRAVQTARSAEDAAALLALAQTVLGGSDTPAAILRHLTETRGGRAELLERVGGRMDQGRHAGPATTAGPAAARPATGRPEPETARTSVRAGADLALVVSGQADPITRGCSTASRPRRRPPSTGTGCAPRPPRPRRWPKATGCGPRYWRR